MPYSPLLLRYMPCLVLLAATPVLQAEKLVVARSTVSGEYLQKRMVDGKRQPQSYVFMAGRYFAGIVHDNTMDRTSFRTIAERLALDLRQQDYHPAASLTKADLLLIVHWGVTYGHNRDTVSMALGMENLANINLETTEARRELDEAFARGDMDAASRARDNLSTLESQTRSEFQTIASSQDTGGEDSATLLGFNAELRKEYRSLFEYERQQAIVGMALEERYFIIVMAYDAPTLLNEKKLKRVWTLRTSIRAAGVNFHQALDRIGNIAGRYFGTRQESVTFDYTGDRKRKEIITLGELVVIGTVDR